MFFALLIAVNLVMPAHAQASDKRLNLALEQKLKFALRLWEVEHSEFAELTRLNNTEMSLLRTWLVTAPRKLSNEDRKAAVLLLTLNCGDVPKNNFRFDELRQYRCGSYPFSSFLANAVLSFESLYTVAFVKPRDLPVALSFLKQYREFWTHYAKAPWGSVLGTADAEYIAELEQFLKKGGLGR